MTAVPADAPDTGVAAHYGDPYAEQRLLASGEGVVDLSHRPVLRISGPDRLGWLHSILSQHLESLAPGESREALVLSPHGHVEHHLHLVETGDEVLAHVEPGTAEPLIQFLNSMRFLMRVEVARADDLAVVWTPDVSGEALATRTGFGSYLLVDRAALPTANAGVMAHEALRVAAIRPRLGLDTDHRTLPHEVGWLGMAVHLDKGCYRGQETVARVHNLGRPPRRLVLLHLDGTEVDLPPTGSAVVNGDREVGRLGTAVRHHELGPIGLALVKRQVPDEATLTIEGIAASIDASAVVAEPPSAARTAADARSSLLRF